MHTDKILTRLHESYGVGPFDGGCLIVAKAMQLALGGSLIRIVSDANGGQTEHYGLKQDGFVVDMSGAYENHNDWMTAFKDSERITDRALFVEDGFDVKSDIVDDAHLSKELAGCFMQASISS